MGTVGLLYVGAILFINGLALMGRVKGTGATPLNWFVGFLQVVTPTYLIFTADGNADQIIGASGLYLFGFTYLYVAMNNTWGHDGTGLGYYSLFVAIIAIFFAVINLVRYSDYAFFVIWLQWSFLWYLFYLVLGRERSELTWFTGGVAAVQGWITAAIPAVLMLAGLWQSVPSLWLGIAEAAVFVIAAIILKQTITRHVSVAR
ncbi:MAG: AmiS/UreI family transporter [Propionibacteriaceae bacterium]|nr:AmiS/UreI family transporter [Propionibacteriaceae bacterium]